MADELGIRRKRSEIDYAWAAYSMCAEKFGHNFHRVEYWGVKAPLSEWQSREVFWVLASGEAVFENLNYTRALVAEYAEMAKGSEKHEHISSAWAKTLDKKINPLERMICRLRKIQEIQAQGKTEK